MKERRWLFFIVSAVCAGITAFDASSLQEQSVNVIVFLIAVALSGVRLLTSMYIKRIVPRLITTVFPCLAILFTVPEAALPLTVVCLTDFFQEIIKDRRRIPVVICLIIVLALVLQTSSTMVFIGFALGGLMLYFTDLMDRRQKDFDTLIKRSERISELENRLGGQKRVAQSMEHSAKIAERSRLAMRLHDEVGHGISGSILLLEGATTVIDTDTDVAKDTIIRATDNLRNSADEIRKVLREEYADRGEAGLARLKSELSHFSSEHPGINTKLIADENVDDLPPHLWACICENMTEALTNMIKHSEANLFSVRIETKNKLLRVVFSDNGGRQKYKTQMDDIEMDLDLEQGIGLAGIEERCALCYGRCFFEKRPDGFYITMTFPLRRSQ